MKPLTDRQLEVLHLIASGATTAEICAKLHLSENTVKVHLSKLCANLGVDNRVGAVVAGFEKGYLTVETAKKAPTPTDVRMSRHGAIAVYSPRPHSQPPWKVVKAAGPYTFLQQLRVQDVAGWETLWDHHNLEGL